MRKIITSLFSLWLCVTLQAQNLNIAFQATGEASALDSVWIENLIQNTELMLFDAEQLELENQLTMGVATNHLERLTIFPNPSDKGATLLFDALQAGKVQISMHSLAGKLLVNNHENVPQGLNHLQLSGVPQGVYLISITGKNYRYSLQWVSVNNSASADASIRLVSSSAPLNILPVLKSQAIADVVKMGYVPGDNFRFTGYANELTAITEDTPTESKTITFNFLPVPKYTVTFNSNGGSNVESIPDVTHETSISQPGNPSRTGYEFLGWFLSDMVTAWDFENDVIISDTTLHAKWDAIPYALTYDLNGGSGTIPPTQTYTVGQSVTIATHSSFLGEEIRDGITQKFIRWNTKADGTGVLYTAGASRTMGATHVTLYAQWTTGEEVIGKVGPARGIVFYVNPNTEDTWKYLEADTRDYNNGAQYKWSQTKTHVSTSSDMGAGMENSIAIKENQGPYSGIAARNALSHSSNGYSDWYLPSYNEMLEVFSKRDLIGGFSNNHYWSSTQANVDEGISVGMSTGIVTYRDKTDQSRRFRPIRRF